jgi:hypothetical protein
MNSFLPFQPISQTLRQFALKQKQSRYKYNFTYIAVLARIK